MWAANVSSWNGETFAGSSEVPREGHARTNSIQTEHKEEVWGRRGRGSAEGTQTRPEWKAKQKNLLETSSSVGNKRPLTAPLPAPGECAHRHHALFRRQTHFWPCHVLVGLGPENDIRGTFAVVLLSRGSALHSLSGVRSSRGTTVRWVCMWLTLD